MWNELAHFSHTKRVPDYSEGTNQVKRPTLHATLVPVYLRSKISPTITSHLTASYF